MSVTIETERLILRELEETDAKGMFDLDSDPAVHQFLGNKPVLTIEQSLADIAYIQQQYIESGIGRWAVIEKDSNQFAGWSGLKLIKETYNNHCNYYDLGYRFIKKFWGKGYATESAQASMKYGFDILKLNEIIGIADTENIASIKVLEKLGLQKINIFDYHGRAHHWLKVEQP
ncbi:GNAT family N-acetyltransferase [Pedobacter sp. MC2016-05]|uniref:GNAT family N-acetyltransferase n=1 Tax=Pedobacter sp. MC2016-05 TaxID=2994474 RepID=UPI0022459DDA|nr:GNAT family N-acetyltransferase [Pedobacter sp. MC2016-05]MCX2473988.1 GNAT family N-acetyltransferase [Pedobacter sp. MC2016-05]